MSLRNGIATLLISLWVLSILLSVQDAKPRNLILITIETLRADHLETYGYTQIHTSNINRLAQKGAVFEHAIASSPLTLPSHASTLTALSPSPMEFRTMQSLSTTTTPGATTRLSATSRPMMVTLQDEILSTLKGEDYKE
jgi:arylsulfatase A-like enzyme